MNEQTENQVEETEEKAGAEEVSKEVQTNEAKEVAAEVETVERILVVGKESTEVVEELGKLIKDIKAGKEITTIAAENLGGLSKAIEGYDLLDDEMKATSRNATIAYSGYVIAEALAPVK